MNTPRLDHHYHLGSLLGRGGFGEVREGEHRVTGEKVAVKLGLGEGLGSNRDRILREVRLLMDLHHPRLANLHGVYQGPDGKLALVYDRVHGSPLSQVYRETRPAWEELHDLIEGIAEAVDFLHQKGILHRDLKPENVMVQPDGRIRLLDFGLSRQLDEGSTLTAEGLLLGTPAYMAPELIGGDRGGPQSDLYSLGVLAYWLASGSVPFPGKNPVELVSRRGAIPSLAAYLGDDRLAAFFDRVLSPAPERRPESGLEFTEELRVALWDSPEEGSGCSSQTLLDLPFPGDLPAGVAVSEPSRKMDRTETRIVSSLPEDPRPRPSRTLVRILVVGIAVLVGGLTGVGSRGRPANVLDTPDVVFPHASEEVRGRLSEFLELGRQTRNRLSDLSGVILGEDGQEIGEGAPLGQDSWDLVGGDPVMWPRVVERLPELQSFYSWIAEGGHPEDLPEAVVQDLEQADAFFLRQGLPAPFGVFLRLVPREEPLVLGDSWRRYIEKRVPGLSVPEALTGWAATALGEARLCDKGLEVKSLLLLGDTDQIPQEIRSLYKVRGGVIGDGMRRVLRASFALRHPRGSVVRWVAPEIRAFLRALAATGRALREEPEQAPWIAAFFDGFLDKGPRYLFQSHLLETPLELILGPAGEDQPGRRLLEYRILNEQQLDMEILPGREDLAQALEKRCQEVLEQALEESREGLRECLWIRAAGLRIEKLLNHGLLSEIPRFYRRVGEVQHPLARSSLQWVRRLVVVAMLKAQDSLGLSREEVRSLTLTPRDVEAVTHPFREQGGIDSLWAGSDQDVPTPKAIMAFLEKLEVAQE